MNKKEKYTINGALIGSVCKAFINVNKQLDALNNNQQETFNWKEVFWESLNGGVIGGGIGYVIGAIADYNNEQIRPINTDPLLLSLVDKVKLNPNNRLYLELCEKAEIIIEQLKKEFAHKLKSHPMRLGSTEKGTALKQKFDIDICMAFRPGSFRSTEEMFYNVFEFLKGLIGKYSIIEVRDQKKSLGVIVSIGITKHKIDVVPFKITNKKGNHSTGYLYLNNKSIWGNYSSYTKTDIDALKNQKLTETQRKIVIILKHLKNKNNLKVSSHLLENLVLDAYQYNFVPRNFTEKLIMVFKHIADNLEVAVIRSIENTNNIITNIPETNKTELINVCKAIVDEYEYQPNSIMNAFA